MSKDRLLSDDGLRAEIANILLLDRQTMEPYVSVVDDLINLVNTQKRLYAESVIGQHHATYNNKLGIDDADYGSIRIAVTDTINAIKNNPSNENQIRYTAWLAEKTIEHASKGIAAKAKYDLIAEQRARIK